MEKYPPLLANSVTPENKQNTIFIWPQLSPCLQVTVTALRDSQTYSFCPTHTSLPPEKKNLLIRRLRVVHLCFISSLSRRGPDPGPDSPRQEEEPLPPSRPSDVITQEYTFSQVLGPCTRRRFTAPVATFCCTPQVFKSHPQAFPGQSGKCPA